MFVSFVCFCITVQNIQMIYVLRNTNQDGLENSFGIIRSCCQAPVAPIAIHYRSAYTTTIVNNLSSIKSISSNCEDDNGILLLNNLHELLLSDEKSKKGNIVVEAINDEVESLHLIVFDPQFNEDELSFLEKEELSNSASFICKKILIDTKCKHCRLSLQSNFKTNDLNVSHVNAVNDTLMYPSSNFMVHFVNAMSFTNQAIPDLCAERELKKKILSALQEISVDGLGCAKHNHEVTELFMNYIVIYAINAFCKNINDYLSGKITSLPFKYNFIQELAQIFRLKRKHKVKYTDIFVAEDENVKKQNIEKTVTKKPIQKNDTAKKQNIKKTVTKKSTRKNDNDKQNIKKTVTFKKSAIKTTECRAIKKILKQ